jgi:hypothetical protein
VIVAVLLSLAAAVFTACQLSRSRSAYRPVAATLALGLIADVAGELLRRLYLVTQPRPYAGLSRVAYHVEQSCVQAWPAAVVAVGLLVLARVRWWPSVAAWGLVVGAHVLAYPWLREERLAQALRVEQAVAVAVLVWCAVRWRKEEREPEHAAALALALGEVLVLLFSFSGSPFRLWVVAQIAYTFVFVWLAVMQRRWRRGDDI